jgi:AcrR family transcriptional regulator
MRKKKLENTMQTKFVEAMLELILEKGGLKEVNLRMVSKRIGCAHTNAYNYFENFDALIFEAYDQAVMYYGIAVSKDLDMSRDANLAFKQFVENIVEFAIEYPGYYRFIGTDDFKIEKLPNKTIEKAYEMKNLFLDLFYRVVKKDLSRKISDDYANILFAYIDGELYTLINKRAYPDERIADRMISNVKKMIELFILDSGRVMRFDDPNLVEGQIPKLKFLESDSDL